MAVTEYSPLTYYKALALHSLAQTDQAEWVLQSMQSYIEQQRSIPAKIDYFATSLPNLLVFDEDLDEAKRHHLDELEELVRQGLREIGESPESSL